MLGQFEDQDEVFRQFLFFIKKIMANNNKDTGALITFTCLISRAEIESRK